MSGNVAIVAFNGFVGHAGKSVLLRAGEEWNLNDPQSKAFYDANQEKFTIPAPEPVRPSVTRLRASGKGSVREPSDG